MQGYIKIHRRMLDWEWYDEPNVLRVFIHCLLKANHIAKKWQGLMIPAGSFVTGRLKLAQELNLTERQIRTALFKLKTTNELTIKSTRQYSIISIKNWNLYQTNDQQNDQQTTNERPTNDQQTTTTKNEKKEREINLSLSNARTHAREQGEREKQINSGGNSVNPTRIGKRERELVSGGNSVNPTKPGGNSINPLRIDKEEREILRAYCKRKKVQNINAYIRKLIENCDYEIIVTEEKQRLEKIQQAKQMEEIPPEQQEPEEVTEVGFADFKEFGSRLRKQINGGKS